MSGPGHVVRAAVERLNANDLAGYYARPLQKSILALGSMNVPA